MQPYDGPSSSVKSLLSELTTGFGVSLKNAPDRKEVKRRAARLKVRFFDKLFMEVNKGVAHRELTAKRDDCLFMLSLKPASRL